MKTVATLLAMAATIAALPAQAQDEEESGSRASMLRESPLPGTPYWLSGMGSYLMTDDDRGLDNGYGAMLGFGAKINDIVGLELNGFYNSADPLAGSGDSATLIGGGLDALVFPITSWPMVYGVVGIGYGSVSDHPGAVADYNGLLYSTGLGFVYPVYGRDVLLRGDARLRMDVHDSDQGAGSTADQNANFYDGIVSVGLMYAWGLADPKSAAAPAEVVATASTDSDNDGVPDDMDKCPGTPAGAVVNAEGCENDEDGDGVPDRIDQCPGTPAGTQVNELGCPLDTDGDGVPDSADECPGTPPGTKVLPNGCALQDDCRQPGPGEQVDENGCAIEQKFTLRGVNFEFDSDRLTDDAKTILVDVAATLKTDENMPIKVEVRGHTDFIGTDEYNQDLSERRAASVKTFLADQGVDAGRMTTIGFGESQPVDPEQTDEARAKNRRVELKVVE